jgi:hypothetical protein
MGFVHSTNSFLVIEMTSFAHNIVYQLLENKTKNISFKTEHILKQKELFE